MIKMVSSQVILVCSYTAKCIHLKRIAIKATVELKIFFFVGLKIYETLDDFYELFGHKTIPISLRLFTKLY